MDGGPVRYMWRCRRAGSMRYDHSQWGPGQEIVYECDIRKVGHCESAQESREKRCERDVLKGER
jgi:hypothetical protein